MTVRLEGNACDPVDSFQYYDEIHQEAVPTEARIAIEAKLGRAVSWFHPTPP